MELYNENLVIGRLQMENILKRQFINNLHWEIFKNNFILKPKGSFFELYRWAEIEMNELKSRC
jgi:hypothetical protein